MSSLSRKSIEPIAMAMGGGRMSALQKFVNAAPWRASSLMKEVQRAFSKRSEAGRSGPMVLTVHEHGFAKKGRESVGVARQWNATTRRHENSQVGIYLVATEGEVSCLLDCRLYLPATWCDGSEVVRRRRLRTHVPVGSHHQTKPQIALELLRRCRAMGLVEADWVVTGVDFSGDGEVIEGLEPSQPRFLVEVSPTEVVFAREPSRPEADRTGAASPGRDQVVSTVSVLCETLPSNGWRATMLRAPGGTIHQKYATVRVRSPQPSMASRPLWLVIRGESDQDCGSLRYFLSNAGPGTPPDTIAPVLHRADAATRFFREAEQYLGLGHYETRSWEGWHHHMSLVALAHWFASSARIDHPTSSRGDEKFGRVLNSDD
jgi:SRSO17 transposase